MGASCAPYNGYLSPHIGLIGAYEGMVSHYGSQDGPDIPIFGPCGWIYRFPRPAEMDKKSAIL